MGWNVHQILLPKSDVANNLAIPPEIIEGIAFKDGIKQLNQAA
ncbi:MAG: hypothetical protein ABJH45_13170 [Paracoccaceae bacterium]